MKEAWRVSSVLEDGNVNNPRIDWIDLPFADGKHGIGFARFRFCPLALPKRTVKKLLKLHGFIKFSSHGWSV